MAATCELCGRDFSAQGSKLVGRRGCVPCAQALFDAALSAKRRPADAADPLFALRDEITPMAEKATAAAARQRGYQINYEKGMSDAYNVALSCVLYEIAMAEQRKKERAP